MRLAWLFTLLFPFSQVIKRKIVCPACGAPMKDLMPNSDLCYRCYWWAMEIFVRYGGVQVTRLWWLW